MFEGLAGKRENLSSRSDGGYRGDALQQEKLAQAEGRKTVTITD